jgi:hypothetical protein
MCDSLYRGHGSLATTTPDGYIDVSKKKIKKKIKERRGGVSLSLAQPQDAVGGARSAP